MSKTAAVLCVCVILAALAAVTVSAAFGSPGSAGTEKMLRGLDDMQLISPEQARLLPEASGVIEITLAGKRLPYDAKTNSYLIPQDASCAVFDGAVEVKREKGYSYYICPSAEGGKAEALANATEYGIYAVRDGVCRYSVVAFTPQTVLCVNTDSGELPADTDEFGALSIFSARAGRVVREDVYVEINERGNTSRRLPKKSYRIHTVNARGKSIHIDIGGLRADDDWILNPLYADTSKIREALAYELWDSFNSVGKPAASSRLVHVEVFINGEYRGLYGLQERVDMKQVDGDKRADLLYKIVSNDRPGASELLNSPSRERCRAFELQNGETSGADNLWLPTAVYMNILEGQETPQTMLNIQNVIDFGLWAMFTQAHDNHFKNQFLNCVHVGGAYTAYKIPWDTNNTFGDVWSGEAVETNYAEYRIGALVTDDVFRVYLNAGGSEAGQAVAARWAELRTDAASAERIIARAREMHAEIQGARMRDSRRWPQCGMGEGNAMNIRDIEDFVEIAVERMDEYVEGLLTDL